MFEGGFRHLPVVEDGRPVGMVSARNALGLGSSSSRKNARDATTRRDPLKPTRLPTGPDGPRGPLRALPLPQTASRAEIA